MYLLAIVLVVVGALNWSLVGLAQFDLVVTLFGRADSALSSIVYGLVGVAGVALVVTHVATRTAPTTYASAVGTR